MPTLKDVMTPDVVTASADEPVAEVAGEMLKGLLGSVVVMDGAYLVGMFTERDVVRAAASGADLTTSPISEWMTPDPVTAAPDTDSEEAAEIMMTQGFRHLPVVEGNTLLGIVSLRDLLSTRIRPRSR